MPRRPEIDERIRLEIKIPLSIFGPMQLELFSPLEGKVPYGKYSEYICALIKADQEKRKQDATGNTGPTVTAAG